MLLGILLSSFGVGNLPSAHAQEAGINSPAPNVELVQVTEPTFADVPFNHPMYQYIQVLYDAGLTAGCSINPLMFCPDTILDRAQSAVFMMRGQLGSGYTPPAAPWPTFAADNWIGFEYAQPWAEGMYQAGLTAGCQTNPLKYCPAVQLNRVQASVFGLKMEYGEDYLPPPATGIFADMTDLNFWGVAWAERAFQEGILLSCGLENGKPMFCPFDLVNRGWGAYLIVKAKGLLPEPTITEYAVNHRPSEITLGPDGALWFTESASGENMIGRITEDGTFSEFPSGRPGDVFGDIVLGPDDALWFTLSTNLSRMTTTGIVTEFTIPAGIVNITLGPDDALWFTGGNQIGRITVTGVVTKFSLPPDSDSIDITSGPDGALWFTTGNNKIGRITTKGVVTEFPVMYNTFNITLGPDGALWFTSDMGNKIVRITTGGVATYFSIPTTTTTSGPGSIAMGSDGALWFTEMWDNQIGRITMTGVVTEYPIPTTDSYPWEIVMGSDGALWFTEHLGNKIGRITVP